ncbi:D-alanyl-D-alanine carboxypeptidase [Gracilibacillus boraciitolerans JCM 21714]|uniref:D-alanyl-D-alanine carboxypeptidase n=1 Tax=Gracilibacillus boraciitolerans JCM 21714 TaxID=1298598 RepID=W4VNC6_9BACI|nr:M15 family metallopeptidase [Gracilibacillus boraciitolerans]GAE94646.1 D-alanyl-D-alanine carboxypeptidase [Gracilibacillus boraciitolerans JCM 21714]
MKKMGLVFIFTLTFILASCEQERYSSEKLDERNYEAEHKEEPETEEVNVDVNEEQKKEQEQQEEQEDQEDQEDSEENSEEKNTDKNNESEQNQDSNQAEDSLAVIENPESVELVVNKQRKLPDGYAPNDLVEANVSYYAAEGDPKRLLRQEAATALEELFKAAKAVGLELVAVSGYRSYERQKQIYESNVVNKGQEHADKFSAKPGTSEHQTGLAMDVASAALVAVLEQSFIETDEGKWLENHAHKYGFVIRYPEGKEAITGYSYELGI